MKRFHLSVVLAIVFTIFVAGCDLASSSSQEAKDSRTVEMQQKQYAASQPVPVFNWSLERDLVIQLYQMRNAKVATHSVWRSEYGMVEGDCPSIGFGIPYDTSLTNPLQTVEGHGQGEFVAVEQPEPNGLFSSKNTSATWVMCAGEGGVIEPVYVEDKVTVYPFPVSVDYTTNRVRKAGASSVSLHAGGK